jgi:uncharacterized protein (DUF2336 family)
MLKLFGRKGGSPAGAMTYEEQRELVQAPEPSQRAELAGRGDVRPEMLYYLAADPSPEVRRALAQNPATPAQADLLLAQDEDDGVRCELARKIGRLIPDLDEAGRARMREMTISALETLAQDQLPRVRAIVSEELKHSRVAPLHVVQRLARDLETVVSAPILEYSPLLSDADLREIIAAGCASGALQAIARRAGLSEDVSDAVVATLDVPAVAALLANSSAQIREETLDRIVEGAASVEAWRQPLVHRPELSLRAVRRISSFVASSLIAILAERHDLDDETAAELAAAARRRVEEAGGELEEAEAARARKLFEQGRLDEEAVAEAVEAGRREFVLHALALLSGLELAAVDRLLRAKQAKPVVALAWKAGLSMRLAIRLQLRTARIPPQQAMHAKNGVDFPLSREEMQWRLDAAA